MKFHSFSFIMEIVVGVIVVGLLLDLKVTGQNKVIQEKKKEIVNLLKTISIKQQEFQKLENEAFKAGEQIKKQMEYIAQPDLPIRVTYPGNH